MRSKIYIYILLIILILANIMQEIFLTRNDRYRNSTADRVWYAKNMQDCRVKTLEWSFFIPNCEQYKQGDFLEVIGSHGWEIDKSFFQLKRLKIQAVNKIHLNVVSVKYWWGRALVVVDHSKTFLLEKGLLFLPQPHSSLVGSMVFGGSTNLTREIEDDFKITGLTHIVSASGYNVSVVASLALAIFSRIFSNKRFSTILVLIVVWSYSIAAELVPPVIRSSIMISINLIASKVFFRQYSLLFSLLMTMGLMLLLEPFYAQSLSFWLSTLATLGIILVLPLLESHPGLFSRLSTADLIQKNELKNKSILKESLLVTLAAQSLTLPLVSAVFGEVSLLSFLTNTVLLWLTPVITLSGLALMIMGVILSFLPGFWEVIGPIISTIVWFPTEVFLSSVEWFGQFEWGLVEFSLPWWAVWCWWGMLGVVILRKKYATFFVN